MAALAALAATVTQLKVAKAVAVAALRCGLPEVAVQVEQVAYAAVAVAVAV
jgi:hypothetical protein